MKKFLVNIAAFFAFVVVIDFCCGFGFDYLKSHATGGNTYKRYFLANECRDDVLILGSSRALRHYVPSIIEDSLELSCYNAGESGCGIIPAYARYKMVAERHKPQLVIYDCYCENDIYGNADYSKFLGPIKQYSGKEPVKEMFKVFGDRFEKTKLLSNMYANNSCIAENIADLFSDTYYDGFEPATGRITKAEIQQWPVNKLAELDGNVDSLRFKYLEKLISETQKDNVTLLLVVSPVYYTETIDEIDRYQPYRMLAQKYSVYFIDLKNIEGLTGNPKLFHDCIHLNKEGSERFTSYLMSLIRLKV